MRKVLPKLFFSAAFLIGISMLLYPIVSEYWNKLHSTNAVSSYSATVAKMSDEQYAEMIKAAKNYNDRLTERINMHKLTEKQIIEYESLLNVDSNGIMEYVEIPSIKCNLPIYHGTNEAVLQTALGHIEWSSLPIGGKSTHTVISGHRGLASAKLFTDLDRVQLKDVFYIKVLDEILTYEVDQILVVEPDETKELEIVKDKDYCTLVTCTPYAVNTHRLLVRGHRINAVDDENLHYTSDGIEFDKFVILPIAAIPIIILAAFGAFSRIHRKNAENKFRKIKLRR